MASLPLVLSALIHVLLTASALAQNNVLLTGQTLGTDGQLSYGGATFVMQGDCNLVLYNQVGGFSSGTHRYGVNCTLSFTDNGRLIIRQAGGSTVWMTNNSDSQNGRYAAVLRPDGQVAIYGPKVWSTSAFEGKPPTQAPPLRNIPLVQNVLFSGQTLYDNGQLTTRDYSFVMMDDCNLALNKAGRYGAIWQTGTSGKGENCFVRLDHRGRITVKDDAYTTVYASSPDSEQGDYVLVLQANGQAVIYGPVAWSTVASRGVKDGDQITMVTVE